ncbi:hypothetical protein [Alkalisalibacterium limincola]|uniref:DUF3300 domain-containing protein n=1 Tax=Alkalisalibacterium limincola TaxID=2699169 RepID=A0A5C8KPT3_9GAMM|nr:hypothetical protein [Alkalisalibacterium limincola]TXK62229.1 hypothetical protein FU658_08230 [Alkalisalibacterium limincola]
MIRRLFIVAVSLAALTACTTYNSGYRHYSPAQAGYGDYYYAPDPGPSYYSPGYLHYPAYYSLYWGFDRHYYSRWHRPHFHYGVTWFPNDWFAFSAVHRYPGYSYWHPYAPYRYSAWDHRFAWHHYSPPPRYRYRSAPRYGHPNNERHMQREHLAAANPQRMPAVGGPRGRSAVGAAAAQRQASDVQRSGYRPQAAMTDATRSAPPGAGEARMRQQAGEARSAVLRDEAARARPALPARQPVQRPWQETQPTPRARTGIAPDAAPPRNIPDRRDSQMPRQVMGEARGAPPRQVTGGRMQQDPRVGEAPRARQMAPAPTQQQRMPVRQAPQAGQVPQGRQEMRQAPQMRQAPAQAPARAPVAPRRDAMPPRNTSPAAPQPRMQQAAPARPAPAPVQQAPARQAMPVRSAPPPAPPVRESAPPARQAAPPTRQSVPRSSGRARGSFDPEP